MNTVTIDLKEYDAMKQRIADLEKQVQEKTIYKEVSPAWYEPLGIFTIGVVAGSVMLAFLNH